MMPEAIKMSQLTVINCDKVHTDTLTHMKSKACTHTHTLAGHPAYLNSL